jgi:NAD(P)-dependent dehydrogenase (short-subunit alcohol dehydrogenase family)
MILADAKKGAFTSIGSTLLETLARRGAHIIALTDKPIDSPSITLLVEALRESTRNERIFVEHCDTVSINSTRAFCTKFLTGNEHRLDAIVFTHEYEHVGPLKAFEKERREAEERRAAGSDCAFLMATLLLPTLLVAPAERDIRIINVVNPFYAASVPRFPSPPSPRSSTFLLEGYRSLRSIILMRHLQRVLDALPQAPAPNPDAANTSVASNRVQKSNIVSVSVSPGFSRHDTICPLLRAKHSSLGFSPLALIL